MTVAPDVKTTSITIRAITPDDYREWKPLWDGYNAFYGRHGTTALPDDITQATWSRFFDRDEPVYANVALCDGQLCGLVHYLFHRSTTALNPVCYLQDLYVDATLRGRGIARQLIESVYMTAKQNDLTRVYWLTHESNHTAMQLYDKVADKPGFIVYRKQLI